ncbi:MAG TPA: hypothetical protein VGL71_11140 [Urbifossiella sp.]|jgi:hypothetical protein
MAAESPRYFLSINQSLRDRLVALNQRAQSYGIIEEWVATMKLAIERLETQPDVAGDPLHRSRHLNLTNYRLLLNRTCIYYSLHDWERIVFINNVVPALDHPLQVME